MARVTTATDCGASQRLSLHDLKFAALVIFIGAVRSRNVSLGAIIPPRRGEITTHTQVDVVGGAPGRKSHFEHGVERHIGQVYDPRSSTNFYQLQNFHFRVLPL